MLGMTPGIFKNIEAVNLVASAYSIEEAEEWTVITKKMDISNSCNIYKPCRVSDYTYEVKADGWVIAE